MCHANRSLVLVILPLALFLVSACQPLSVTPSHTSQAVDPEVIAQFEAGVEELRQELNIPGLSAAIVKEQEVVDTVPNPDAERAAEILAEMARPYQVDDSGTIVLADYQTTGHVDAASGMVSTVLDLAKFDAAMDRNLLVSADTKATMFTPTVSNSGDKLPYGMGWFVQEHDGT